MINEKNWMNAMKNMFLTLSALCCLAVATQLFAGSMTAELDRTRVDTGETAQLSVTISGSLKDDISLPQVQGLSFQQMGTSANVQIVNGSFSKETTYTFAISADRAGTFQIPSIKATIDKEEIATPPLTVTFGGGSVPPGSPAQPNAGGAQPGQSPQGNEPPFIFIERELSNQNPYEGQAIVSTVRIFARVRVTSMVPERDSSPGWRVISKDGQKNYETVRDNARWHVIEINEVIVPLKSGALAPPSFSLQTTFVQPTKQRIRRGSIWDLLQGGMMDMGQEVSKKISSDSKPIQIRPLPQEGRPAVVSDIVGDFKVSVDVSKQNLNSGETSTVSVKISGRGALDRMAEIKLPTLVGAKIYPDKPQLKETIDENGLKSSKEYKFAIVPSQPGDLRLGNVELGIFNPITAKWYSLKEDLGILTVAGAAGAVPQNAIAANVETQAPSAAAPPDTNHNQISIPIPIQINPAMDLGTTERPNPLKWFGIAIVLVGVLAVAVFAKPLHKRYRKWSDSKAVSKTPYGLLTTLVAKSSDEPHALFAAMQKVTAAGDQDPKSMTAHDMRRAMDSKGVPTALAEKIQRALEEVESSDYRGTTLNQEMIARFVADLRELAAWVRA